MVEFAVVLVLVIANGVFSMAETAVVSSRKARLHQRASEGDTGARAALELAGAPNVFLATVQVGITLIGVLSGAFGGAAIAHRLAAPLARVGPLAPYADAIAFGAVVIVLTYLSLVLGELVPKRLALNDPEGVAARVAGPMRRLARLASPVVRFLGASTDVVLRLLRTQPSQAPPVTAEEIGVLLEQGARAGVFEHAEREMVEGVFELADEEVATLMTPRPDVAWLDLEAPPEEIRRAVVASPHTRFPVCRGELDRVEGVARAKDLLEQCLGGRPVDLVAVVRPPLLVPEATGALQLLERFRQAAEQLAIVVDEYGGVAGVVTLQDVLEAIVGDLPTTDGHRDPRAVQRPDGSWLLDGALPADEVAEPLGLPDLPGERQGYHTLAGFILAQLGRIPDVGDAFEASGWRFEVADMDGNRVDRVLATPVGDRDARQDAPTAGTG